MFWRHTLCIYMLGSIIRGTLYFQYLYRYSDVILSDVIYHGIIRSVCESYGLCLNFHCDYHTWRELVEALIGLIFLLWIPTELVAEVWVGPEFLIYHLESYDTVPEEWIGLVFPCVSIRTAFTKELVEVWIGLKFLLLLPGVLVEVPYACTWIFNVTSWRVSWYTLWIGL
jgi:hypothetical protein